MSLYVLSHIAAWTQGRPLLPALRNSGRFLTIPLTQSAMRRRYKNNFKNTDVVVLLACTLSTNQAKSCECKLEIQKKIIYSHSWYSTTNSYQQSSSFYALIGCDTVRILYGLDHGVPNSAHFLLEAIFIYFIFFHHNLAKSSNITLLSQKEFELTISGIINCSLWFIYD